MAIHTSFVCSFLGNRDHIVSIISTFKLMLYVILSLLSLGGRFIKLTSLLSCSGDWVTIWVKKRS